MNNQLQYLLDVIAKELQLNSTENITVYDYVRCLNAKSFEEFVIIKSNLMKVVDYESTGIVKEYVYRVSDIDLILDLFDPLLSKQSEYNIAKMVYLLKEHQTRK